MDRNLDGLYFRIQRNGKWCNVCFSDMASEEIEEVTKDRQAEWWKSVAIHLAECLKKLETNLTFIKNNNRSEIY